MGEGKYVLDMARIYPIGCAFGIAANLEGFLLSVDQRGHHLVVSYLGISHLCSAHGRIPFSSRFSVGEREWWIVQFSR